jgi:hypothetical protein
MIGGSVNIRRTAATALAALALLTAAACGDSGPKDQESPPDPLTASPPVRYESRAFVVPLTVKPAPGLESRPIDASNLISWDAVGKDDNKIRILAPVEIYRPGATKPEALPKDFLAYVKGLSAAGVTVTDEKQIEVDGGPTTLLTMTRTAGAKVDGVLGCPGHGEDQVEDCFAPQADLVMRMAIFTIGTQPVLVWARVPTAQPDQAFFDGFEKMVSTLEFN